MDKLAYEDGEYSFTDSMVISNVEYSYSIIAKNDKGLSPASEVTGYLLSPVTNMKLSPVNDGSLFGYVFSYDFPAGRSFISDQTCDLFGRQFNDRTGQMRGREERQPDLHQIVA